MLPVKSEGKRKYVSKTTVETLEEKYRNAWREEKYWGILEADTIKQVEMNEKYEKSKLEEREFFLKPSSAAEISLKG